ncbi:hypothetical protein JP75_06515 [Devosia riboflavina]|uniref:Uncharacterized protein n=1 Tax=Devosia riboflavina TaxID=46914 RepID=A0A087M4B9_9HYPH|nr:hypothetical protein [Devosia riboflavina]KFL31722.1 hypothetical protein JP75_06515 [Devosia riboflavina]
MRPPNPDYSVSPARYAKGMLAVKCPSPNGYKTRAARLIGDGLKCRWSNRERAYIVPPTKLARFEVLFAEGWDASTFTGKLEEPRVAA